MPLAIPILVGLLLSLPSDLGDRHGPVDVLSPAAPAHGVHASPHVHGGGVGSPLVPFLSIFPKPLTPVPGRLGSLHTRRRKWRQIFAIEKRVEGGGVFAAQELSRRVKCFVQSTFHIM